MFTIEQITPNLYKKESMRYQVKILSPTSIILLASVSSSVTIPATVILWIPWGLVGGGFIGVINFSIIPLPYKIQTEFPPKGVSAKLQTIRLSFQYGSRTGNVSHWFFLFLSKEEVRANSDFQENKICWQERLACQNLSSTEAGTLFMAVSQYL